MATLVAVDAALVALALYHTAPDTSTEVYPPSSPSASATGRTATAEPVGPGRPQVQPVPLQAGLVALGPTVAWRTFAGSCGSGGGSVAITTDGGQTWTAKLVPSARTVIRVLPSSAARARVVSGGQDCRPGLQATDDGGTTWRSIAGVNTLWLRDPENVRVVSSPTLAGSRPCDDNAVVDLAPVTASAAQVLCGDGGVRGTTDSGRTWGLSGSLPGAIALDSRIEQGGTSSYLVREAQACAGLEVTRVGGTAPAGGQPLGCIALGGTPVEGGRLDISIYGVHGWVTVGERVWRSRDGMRTWGPA